MFEVPTTYTSLQVNTVISSPTGSGKTVLFELAIIRLFSTKKDQEQPKVVYMAPIKALCQEKTEDWTKKFGKVNLTCKELTGDTESIENIEQSFKNIDIILTTPEKWDSTSRRWKDRGMMGFMSQVSLILIDEVHLLNEERGAVLEAVVSRMKTLKKSEEMADRPSSNLRFIALSATIPNIEDIGQWINAPNDAVLVFGDEYRPCKLDVHVVGVRNNSSNPYLFERSLTYKLLSVIQEHSSNKPTIIFCSTRKSASESASILSKEVSLLRPNPFITDPSQRKRLLEASSQASDKVLSECIINAVAYHCAGLSAQDRKLVESLFLCSDVLVVCTTSTLAQGVNLPARLCIIKGTQQYKTGSGYEDYNELMMVQMMGRAGRPQFDDKGVAVILTDQKCIPKWQDINNKNKPVESHLQHLIIEHLNAEIVLETVQNVRVAIEWLKSTFLYIRMMKNPMHYNLPQSITREKLEQHLKQMCTQHLEQLSSEELINMDGNGNLHSTELGRSMARFYIKFETMQTFNQANNNASSSQSDILTVLCKAKEFQEHSIRLGQKKILNALNKKNVMQFPIKGRIKDVEDKVNVLIQAAMVDAKIEDWTLMQQTNQIFAVAPRIARCLIDYVKEKKRFHQLSNSLLLSKCIHQKMWHANSNATRQVDGIGAVFSNTLQKAGITNLQTLEKIDSFKIESILGRNPPFGRNVLEKISKIPKYDLSFKCENVEDSSLVSITVIANRRETAKYGFDNIFQTLITGNRSNDLIDYKRFCGAKYQQFKTTFQVDARQSCNCELKAKLISDQYIGFDVDLDVTIQKINRDLLDTDQVITHTPKNKIKPPSVIDNSLALMKNRTASSTLKMLPKVPPLIRREVVRPKDENVPIEECNTKQQAVEPPIMFNSSQYNVVVNHHTRNNLVEMVRQYVESGGRVEKFQSNVPVCDLTNLDDDDCVLIDDDFEDFNLDIVFDDVF
ncbi:ATP-dependent DNA helicase Hfm1 [Acrasis kona]|uniref:DNA 3'-5' helicase n=1 Tax=Acrasis kona TaxID=1008807 RepID=A0AAW2YJM8_9EUKA